MYTGIIQACLPVTSVDAVRGLTRFSVTFDPVLLNGLKHGASVSIDGVCLTVSDIRGHDVFFDAMGETLAKTTLSDLETGRRVNVERSAVAGAEIGGHVISGHVHATAKILKVESSANNRVMTVQLPSDLVRYVFDKGFIALDGASLTVVGLNEKTSCFNVWFIPETLSRTTFGFKKAGDLINVEIDQTTRTIVDTIERILSDPKITKDFLK